MGNERHRSRQGQRDRERESLLALMPVDVKGRVPPHDLDAEAAVLSACLLDAESIFRTRPILGDDRQRYYSVPNGMVWEGIIAVHKANKPVDIVSVASWLRDRDWLLAVGGPSYLAQLADATPAVAHVESHAMIVHEKWRLRATIATSQKIAAEGYGDVGTVQEFIDGAAQAMDELSHGSPERRDPVRAGEVLGKELTRLEAGGGLFGIPTGFVRIDKRIAGLHTGDLYVIAARPGMGKSALALDVAINVSAVPTDKTDPKFEQTEYAAIFFSLEMPREQLAMRACCSVGAVDFGRVRQGFLEREDWTRLTNAAEWIYQLPLWIDDTPAITAVEIRSKVLAIKRAWEREASPGNEQEPPKRARKVGAVIVDYIQLMRGRGNERSKEETVGGCSQDLKALAKMLHVPVIALAQLNREVEKRLNDKRPQLADLRDSGQIEQDADTIVFIYRAEYYKPSVPEFRNVAELIIAKQRNGPTGKTLVRFDPQFTRFSDFEETAYHEVSRDYGSVKQ